MEIRKLNTDSIEEIKFIIKEAFSREPWNDDWTDENQFHAYILDLIGNPNSLSLGLYKNDELIGVSLGRIKHWYAGTEYWIDDLAVFPKTQGRGCGSKFIDLIEDYIKEQGIVGIVLFTEKIYLHTVFMLKNLLRRKKREYFLKST